ncbi:TauD/TfdA family dioxygenase [Streptomyces sp. URMC 123]|uniref:TauD/TfdA family dioxygenase n=1 Tax=Streptomyces sp. URMC 123 TaxID=3423403 RepID=UPI003F1D6664
MTTTLDVAAVDAAAPADAAPVDAPHGAPFEVIDEPGRTPLLRVAAGGPEGGDAAAWAAAHREAIRAELEARGAVLLRGLGVTTPDGVAAVARALGVEPMVERERFAGRRELGDRVYSSSEWPHDEPICMHHELSYAAEVPATAVFGCLTAPAGGGATTVADSQEVLTALPADLVARFRRDGWLLRRCYHEVGVAWSEAFGTEDQAEIDAYCAAHAIDHEWLPDGVLRTRQRRAVVIEHPVTGRPVWFNQAAFLNELTLDPMIREYLLALYGPEGLPFNTAYGDGEPIPAEVVETINAAYRAATRREPWQAGDVLLVDNLRMAHSREAYQGEREIAVVLGDPVRLPGHVLDGVTA